MSVKEKLISLVAVQSAKLWICSSGLYVFLKTFPVSLYDLDLFRFASCGVKHPIAPFETSVNVGC